LPVALYEITVVLTTAENIAGLFARVCRQGVPAWLSFVVVHECADGGDLVQPRSAGKMKQNT
jgi:hypothetical protein